MRILYLDTSSSFLYCGLFDDDTEIFEVKENLGKKMSEEVLYRINSFFNEKKVSTDSVEKIILVNGPGSFTGVRIGITIAKVYSYMLKVPIITISSLYAMALSSKEKCIHVPIIDARRGYVFSAIYDENCEIIMKEKYISILELENNLSGIDKKYEFISNDEFEFSVNNYDPDIKEIVYKCKNMHSTDVHSVNAMYLKSTEAEEKKNDN